MDRQHPNDGVSAQVRRLAAQNRTLEREQSTNLLDLEEYGNALLSLPSGDFRSHCVEAQEEPAQMVRAMRVHVRPDPAQSRSCGEGEDTRNGSKDRKAPGRMSRLGAQQPEAALETCAHPVEAQGHCSHSHSHQSDSHGQPHAQSDYGRSPAHELKAQFMPRSESMGEPTNGELEGALEDPQWGFSDSAQGPSGIGRSATSGDGGASSKGGGAGGSHNKTIRRAAKNRTRVSARARRDAVSKTRGSSKLGISEISGDDIDDEEDFLTSVPPAAQDVLLGDPEAVAAKERSKQRWQNNTVKVRTSAGAEKFHSPSSWEQSDWSSHEDASSANRPSSASSVTPGSRAGARRPPGHHPVPPRSSSIDAPLHSEDEVSEGSADPVRLKMRGGLPKSGDEAAETPGSRGTRHAVPAAAAAVESLESHTSEEYDEEYSESIRRVLTAGTAEGERLKGDGEVSADEEPLILRSKTTPAGDFVEEEEEDEEEEEEEEDGKVAEGGEQPQLARNLSLPHSGSVDEVEGVAAVEAGSGDDKLALERNLSLQGQAGGSGKKAPKGGVGAMMRLGQFLGKKGGPGGGGGRGKGGPLGSGSAGKMRPPKPLMNLSRPPGLMRQNSADFKEFADLPAPKRVHFQLTELQLATENFTQRNILGQGGFGTVYFGLLPVKPAQQVAIKMLKKTGTQADEEFKIELELLSRLEHKHLVKLLGFCWTNKDKLLVYEYMSNGSLYDHLHGKKREENGPLSWDRRLRIAVGAARGLRYLHAQRPQILHRDIKAANILLTEKLAAKVADFGCAKLIRQTVTVENEETGEVVERLVENVDVAMGTHGLMAPEILMTGEVSASGDIYSFGVVLLELISGLQPIMSDGKQLVSWAQPLLDAGKWDELVDPCILDQRGGVSGVIGYGFKARVSETSSLVKCAQLAKSCISYDPLARPSMDEVAHALQIIYFEKDATPAQAQAQVQAKGGGAGIGNPGASFMSMPRGMEPRSLEPQGLQQRSSSIAAPDQDVVGPLLGERRCSDEGIAVGGPLLGEVEERGKGKKKGRGFASARMFGDE